MATRAFIVRPFGKKRDGEGNEIDFDAVQAALIDPALRELGFEGGTTVEIVGAGNIREDMFGLLVEADLVIADISIHNANVFYELGVRHALRDRRTFMIRCRADDPPFDLLTDRYLEYDRTNPAAALPALVEGLRQTRNADETDSPVFRLVPGLVPQDPATLIAVPLSFGEEVEYRRREGQPGDLDMLADEVQLTAPRWVQQGLRLIGRAQFADGRWEGARHTWEAIREVNEDDVEANVKLATVHAKLGERTRSDQAIERALAAGLAEDTRAELYALKGSNEKTEWLLEWEDATGDPKRTALVSAFLTRAYDAYREGFLLELNHCYSGINALMLLSVRLLLADELPDEWADGFTDEDEAGRQLTLLRDHEDALRKAVGLSVEAARARVARTGVPDAWPEITAADLALISGERPGRVERLYRTALAAADRQQLDSVDRQLRFLERLGLRAEQVRAAREVVRERRGEVGDAGATASVVSPRILLFTGHRIDAPGRATPRFPPEAESAARAMIERAVDAEIDAADGSVIGVAGAASGGDILFHEICEQRGLETRVFLAGPRAEYVQNSVQDGGPAWVARFDALVERRVAGKSLFQLGSALSLPRWLDSAKGYTVWERNNLWTLHNAMSISGASRTVLIALWNGLAGDGPGGTRDMVDRAGAWGARTVILPAAELTSAVTGRPASG